MGSGGRAVLCKSASFYFLTPSLSSSQLRFNPSVLQASSPATPRFYRMATGASSSNSSATGGDDIKPSSASSAIDFLSICHRLKTTKRAGWVKRDVKDPESIADHMYRMGLMALVASDIPNLDRNKCIKMAIVHDIAEALVGDITPSDGISKEEKSRREQEALDHMCKVLGSGPRAKEIGELWMEYEANSSPEAKFVKDLDKGLGGMHFAHRPITMVITHHYNAQYCNALPVAEMILQALEYEREQGKDLDEFFQSTAGKFQTEVGKTWALEIASRRKNS